jgi:hypothetical protein
MTESVSASWVIAATPTWAAGWIVFLELPGPAVRNAWLASDAEYVDKD